MTTERSQNLLNRRGFTPRRILAPRILLIIIVAALLLFGLVMVFSASSIIGLTEQGDSFYFFKRQLQMVGIGLVGLIVAAVVPYPFWRTRLSWVVWGALILLLIATLVLGNEQAGGKRWIDIFGLNIQPSEFAKIACMLLVASLLVQLYEDKNTKWSPFIAKVAFVVGLPLVLIMLQPDRGTLMVAVVGILAVAWFGELPRRVVFIGLLLLFIAGVASIMGEGYQEGRLSAFRDPWADPLGFGYQTINSYYAFGDGGIFGVGLGMSRQKYLYLPEAQNDFIFAIIGEELGLIGALVVVVLFVLFVLTAFRIGANAPGVFGRVIACSSATLIGAQAFLNILCVVGLAPITGKPLPFISAGGTSMIATLVLVGLILSVSFHSDVPSEAELRRDSLRILDGGQGVRVPAPNRTRPQRPGLSGGTAGATARVGATRASVGATARASVRVDATRASARTSTRASVGASVNATRSNTPFAASSRVAPTSFAVAAVRRRENPALRLSPARNQRRSPRTSR
ncbi:MAG: putative lipid II flippase FtsW [Coriobacteriales bacterium]|jgi:cell division protein FtsW|nr:putative lipid II flippase FtsW [Coriobacteriales bacterium]